MSKVKTKKVKADPKKAAEQIARAVAASKRAEEKKSK